MEDSQNLVPTKIMHRSSTGISSDIFLNVIDLSTKQRFINAFKYLGLCLAAGAVFILVPVLHFVLVPSTVFAGGFLFYRQLSFKHYRLESEAACPSCESQIKLKAKPFNWPMHENCTSCRSQLIAVQRF